MSTSAYLYHLPLCVRHDRAAPSRRVDVALALLQVDPTASCPQSCCRAHACSCGTSRRRAIDGRILSAAPVHIF